MKRGVSEAWWVRKFSGCIFLCQLVTAQTGIPAQHTERSSIEVLNPPERVSEGHILQVLYHCEEHQVVHIDVLASSLTLSAVRVFKRRWTCSPGETEKMKEVRLDFPDQMVYAKDYFLRHSIYVRDVLLRAWIGPSDMSTPDRSSYSSGMVRTFHFVESFPPNRRPYKDHQRTLRWDQEFIWRFRKDSRSQCRAEQEVVHLLTFPYACSGESFGVLRTLEPYRDGVLERRRQRSATASRCSFSTWVFLLQWCPLKFCGVLYHLDHSNKYISPAVLLTSTGHLHVQMELVSGESQAFKSLVPIPLYEWCRIQLILDTFLVNLTVICAERPRSMTFRFTDNILLADTMGFFILGGSEFVRGMDGFFGPTVYHRNRIPPVYQARPPTVIENLDFSQWFRKCQRFREECSAQFQRFLLLARTKQSTGNCSDAYRELVTRYSKAVSPGPQCMTWEAPPPPHRASVTRLLRKVAGQRGHVQLDTEPLGRVLYRTFMTRVLALGGLARIRASMPLLLQAGCLGYTPALYLASVLLQTGFGIKTDYSKALRFSLISAQEDERLSQMFLGHKHHLGVDRYPVDYGLSYAYYSNVARQTILDRLHPDKNQAFVEHIRLIDEDVLRHQTKENDDLFMWLRFQAKQGVSSAQQAVSRMLFWGQQGISSNLQAAVKFYEKGARQLKDPVMMYDYGVVLLRGQGVQQDIPTALEFLRKAADLDFVPAINSLGWYYEQYEKDYRRAVELWERADKLGNPEAPFNLGIMHSHGLYPGKQKDHFTAYTYFLKSASRGHIDAAVYLSAYWSQGILGTVRRQPLGSVVWTKWASEQNGYLGAVLRRSLDGYLKHSWHEAVLHYIQAAEAGFEIAQFNAAYICEEDPDGLVSRFIQVDCVWKYYNLSTHSDKPHSYAQVKMGDLLYAGHERRKRDVQAAVHMYKSAALQRDPQGLYSLGILVEEGVSLPSSTLRELGFNSSASSNNYTIMMELYRRCRDHEKEDSYVPCSLALLNAHLQYVWAFHSSIVKCSSAAAIAIVTALSLMTIVGRLQNGALRLQQSV
ncbi:protein sel-1 homolog 3-like [Ascaphus truei]|uniref:protein sel-1 homolog 3-like n=1 Tax=Ascaphus truei TaxID=8439 RepID=UPI003F5AA8B3